MRGIPARPEDVTSDWLTEALRSTQTIGQARVKSFRMRPFGVEQAFSGELVRLGLQYSGAEKGVPASLVGKFSPIYPHGYDFQQNSSEREIRFYKKTALQIGLRTPCCHYAAIDRKKGVSVLLLEDLSHLRRANLTAGCTFKDVELVIRKLARMHAGYWESPQFRKMKWLPFINSLAECPFQRWWSCYPQCLREILSDQRIPDAFWEVGKRLAENMSRAFDPLAESPVTCVHGDVHADNLLFGKGGTTPSLVLLDWELAARGKGVSDVTYFMVSSVPVSLRRQSERRLLETYHGLLVRYGVQGYSFDQCWIDYQRSICAKLLVTVAATVLCDNSSQERRAWRRADLQRLNSFIEDHAVGEFF